MRKRTPEDRARSEEIGRRLCERVARIEAELAEKAKASDRRRRRSRLATTSASVAMAIGTLGHRASRWVRDYGVRLRPRLYRNSGPYRTRAEAEAAEIRLANKLRRRGFCVFGGH